MTNAAKDSSFPRHTETGVEIAPGTTVIPHEHWQFFSGEANRAPRGDVWTAYCASQCLLIMSDVLSGTWTYPRTREQTLWHSCAERGLRIAMIWVHDAAALRLIPQECETVADGCEVVEAALKLYGETTTDIRFAGGEAIPLDVSLIVQAHRLRTRGENLKLAALLEHVDNANPFKQKDAAIKAMCRVVHRLAAKLSAELPAETDRTKASKSRVFICHSSIDKPLVERLASLLANGCDISRNDIDCTSLEGMGVAEGKDDSTAEILDRMRGASLVIMLISESFLKSPFCLNEVGAAWMGRLTKFPLVVPPVRRDCLPGVLAGTQAGAVDDPASLDGLHDEIKRLLSHEVPTATWNVQRDLFLAEVHRSAEPPRVIATNPANGTIVDPSVSELTATFSTKMNSGRFFYVDSTAGVNPVVGKPHLLADGCTFVIRVVLEANHNYALWLNSPDHSNFRSVTGKAAEPYHLQFRTGEESADGDEPLGCEAADC